MTEASRGNWLFFGAGSPEPKYLGSRYNVGAAAIDFLAAANGAVLCESGSIRSTLIEIGGRSVRLVKPNVIPEMIGDVCELLKNKHLCKRGSIVIFYGDGDFAPGEVKMKTSAGGGGHLVVTKFLKAFDPDVIRFRIGMGRPKKRRHEDRSEDLEEGGERVLVGIKNALLASKILIRYGYKAAHEFVDLANRGKEQQWLPKS